jgi:hypothetical protein
MATETEVVDEKAREAIDGLGNAVYALTKGDVVLTAALIEGTKTLLSDAPEPEADPDPAPECEFIIDEPKRTKPPCAAVRSLGLDLHDACKWVRSCAKPYKCERYHLARARDEAATKVVVEKERADRAHESVIAAGRTIQDLMDRTRHDEAAIQELAGEIDEERQRAEAAEQRVAELKAEIERLRSEPVVAVPEDGWARRRIAQILRVRAIDASSGSTLQRALDALAATLEAAQPRGDGVWMTKEKVREYGDSECPASLSTRRACPCNFCSGRRNMLRDLGIPAAWLEVQGDE